MVAGDKLHVVDQVALDPERVLPLDAPRNRDVEGLRRTAFFEGLERHQLCGLQESLVDRPQFVVKVPLALCKNQERSSYYRAIKYVL